MMKTATLLQLTSLAALLNGCSTASGVPEAPEIPAATVTRTQLPVTLDGKLDDAAWATTPGFELKPIDMYSGLPKREAARIARDPYESAVVKFLYDDRYLYVAAALTDSDVTAYSDRDQELLFRYGDLLEVFLYPEQGTWYWEIYAAPNGARSSFFYPGGGQLGNWEFFTEKYLMKDFAVASRIGGTRNNHNDRDNGWSTEMRIPLRELEKAGIRFAPGIPWRIMVSRYNFGAGLYRPQLSSFPPLPGPDFHLRQYYAPVVFR